jgi:chromosome segregation ATPase
MEKKIDVKELLKDGLKILDEQFDSNLERMAKLHSEIQTYKDANSNIVKEMRKIRARLDELEGN